MAGMPPLFIVVCYPSLCVRGRLLRREHELPRARFWWFFFVKWYILFFAGFPADKEIADMFDFNNAKNRKIFIWVIVVILILAMVVPTAYSLIAALVG